MAYYIMNAPKMLWLWSLIGYRMECYQEQYE